ncbi:MAG TPA: transcriptional repressor [archaeon]|nr:transcriptional repressor [archaeon]
MFYPGRRMTKQRKIILDELNKMGTHPTAAKLYECVRQRLPDISLGTVYRNLQILAADGVIRTLKEGDRMRFDSDLSRHYHIRCLICCRVDDLAASAVSRVVRKPACASGYQILGFKVEFVGICPDCESENRDYSSETLISTDYRLISAEPDMDTIRNGKGGN